MGRKKEEDCYRMVYIPKRVVEVPFFLSFLFIFGFWFLVFWFFTVALLAWRVVFFCFFFVSIGLGWVGLYTTWGKVLPSTGLQVHVTFFIDEMAGGGMEGWYREGPGRVAASGRFFAEKSRTDRNLPLLALVVLFFVFYEVGW